MQLSYNGRFRWPGSRSLIPLCKYGCLICAAQIQNKKITQLDARANYTFTALLPQSAQWIIYESADRRGAGSTRRVPLGRNNSRQSGGGSIWSCGIWILMVVQWSRYATQQCTYFPASAEKSGCVQTGNLWHGSTHHMLYFWSSFSPVLSPRCFLLQFCLLKCLLASLSTFPYLVLIHIVLRMSISDFLP